MSQTQQNSRKTARKISKTDFYFVTVFYSLDDICIAFLRHPYYLLRHKRGDVATCLYGVADERAADVIESGVEEADGRGEGGDVDVATRARIDGDGVVGDDVFVMIPTAEHLPVVGSYEERELAVGVGGGERLQRVPHI